MRSVFGVLRVLVFLMAVAAVGACTRAAAPSPQSTPPVGSPAASLTGTPPLVVDSPDPGASLPPHVQCALWWGMRLETTVPSRLPGGATGYGFTTDLPNERAMAILEECAKLSPWRHMMTDEDIRAVYERWVRERECLVDLGYQPDKPPPFERFLVTWRTTGPWMPIDGLSFDDTHRPQFSIAQQRCLLEMAP
jgi:hypothetical protein